MATEDGADGADSAVPWPVGRRGAGAVAPRRPRRDGHARGGAAMREDGEAVAAEAGEAEEEEAGGREEVVAGRTDASAISAAPAGRRG